MIFHKDFLSRKLDASCIGLCTENSSIKQSVCIQRLISVNNTNLFLNFVCNKSLGKRYFFLIWYSLFVSSLLHFGTIKVRMLMWGFWFSSYSLFISTSNKKFSLCCLLWTIMLLKLSGIAVSKTKGHEHSRSFCNSAAILPYNCISKQQIQYYQVAFLISALRDH